MPAAALPVISGRVVAQGSGTPGGPFRNPLLERTLEDDNAVFWAALLERIGADYSARKVKSVLDIGCHYGGLLELMARCWSPNALFGIEPLLEARAKAQERLFGLAERVAILSPDEWSQIPLRSLSLITCHEVLYLVEDLPTLMGQVASRLGESGHAYFVLGCHAENPIWPLWKPKLAAMGLQTYDHSPMDILAAGARYRLQPSIQPLRTQGWIDYNPLLAEFSFPDAETLIKHHFQHKLLFRFSA